MKARLLLILLFLSVLPALHIQVTAQEPDTLYYADLELERPYGFRGESLNITAYSNHNAVIVEIFDPDDILIYNQTWAGNESRLIPIQASAKYGDHLIRATVPHGSSDRWLTVVHEDGFSPVSFPFYRRHKDVDYYVYGNRTLVLVRGDDTFSVWLPDLPDSVEVNCYNNSDIFTARFRDDFLGLLIDLSMIFVHDGAKMVINGTSDSQKDFRFQFYSPRQIKKWLNRINAVPEGVFGVYPNALCCDWSDLVRAKEHLTWDSETQTLIVHDVPRTFRIDPSFGYYTEYSSHQGCTDWINNMAATFEPDHNGTADSITWWIDVQVSASLHVQYALYDASHNLLNITEESAALSSGQEQYITLNFSQAVRDSGDVDLVNGTTYRLGIWAERDTSVNDIRIHYSATGSSGDHRYSSNVYNPPNWEDPLTGTDSNRLHTVWCNYTQESALQEYEEEFTETIEVTESTQTFKALEREASETVRVVVLEQHERSLLFWFSETVTVSDQTLSWRELLQSFTETVVVSDQLEMWRELYFSFSELVQVSDFLEITTETLATFFETLETVQVSDLLETTTERILTIFETLETVTVTESPTFAMELISVVSYIAPVFEMILCFIGSWFFSLGFIFKRKYWYGYLAFIFWLLLGGIWLLIEPVGYAVAFLFNGIGIIFLIVSLIMQLDTRKRLKEEGEET